MSVPETRTIYSFTARDLFYFSEKLNSFCKGCSWHWHVATNMSDMASTLCDKGVMIGEMRCAVESQGKGFWVNMGGFVVAVSSDGCSPSSDISHGGLTQGEVATVSTDAQMWKAEDYMAEIYDWNHSISC